VVQKHSRVEEHGRTEVPEVVLKVFGHLNTPWLRLVAGVVVEFVRLPFLKLKVLDEKSRETLVEKSWLERQLDKKPRFQQQFHWVAFFQKFKLVKDYFHNFCTDNAK